MRAFLLLSKAMLWTPFLIATINPLASGIKKEAI